jgi:hypothetical protein
MEVVRTHGPWQLILAESFETPEEVIATTSGELPEGVEPTWEMLLRNPVFRGYLARQGVCFNPELDHTDDITHEQAIGMLIDDMRRRGVAFEMPTDPMKDRGFVRLVSQVYDIGGPTNIPPDAMNEMAA